MATPKKHMTRPSQGAEGLADALPADDAGPAAGPAERAPSQTVHALISLRELLLSGEIEPGERLSELTLVERLGASRTPVRNALARLAEEGFLDPIRTGGYRVKLFTSQEIHDAVDVRGTLEGLAARYAAERGISRELLSELESCLARIDAAVFRRERPSFSLYMDLNNRFHTLLRDAAGSPTLARQIDRANAYPFASHSAFMTIRGELPDSQLILTIAQDQHRQIVDALRCREGARAEAIVREHARLAVRNIGHALRNRRTLAQLPGAALIAEADDAS